MLKKTLPVLCCIFMLLVWLPSNLSAQNTKRGYKLLEKADYVKSMELFKGAISENKDNPAALFGIALIYADDSSSYFDLIEAWKFANRLKPNIEKLTEEEITFIKEYFYNTESRHIPRPVKTKIEYAVNTIEDKLIKYVREENNLDLVYRVLKEFPEYRHYDNVVHIRNQLEFRKYEKMNQLEGYLEFMNKFPEAAQIEKAVKYRNRLAFEEAVRMNTVEAYRDYMKKYPNAAENNMAIKNLYAVAFQKAKGINTIQALDDYITTYPDALEISEAKLIQKQLMYEYAKKIQTLEAYNEFISKYPEGQQYIDIFNLKALDNGMHFITANPLPTNNVLWARSFDESANNELSACLAVDTLNSYLIAGTVFRADTGSSDAWIIKLNQDGKMIWNKYVGEPYNDEVKLVTTSKKNEILGAGYTWTGIDSSSVESWLFKLSGEGQKIWSRKLGKMHINSLHPATDGRIFIGGYLINDSLERKYSVVVLNENGKRLWGRTYTGKGEIVKIDEFSDHNLLIVGNRWKAKTDPKGYLVWESSFAETDSIVDAYVLPWGEINYLGIRNKTRLVFIKTNAANKPMVEKEVALPFVPVQVNGMVRGIVNQMVTLVTANEGQFLCWINTANGELLKSVPLPAGIKAKGIDSDKMKNLLIVACDGSLVIIKNSGLIF